MKFFQYIPLIGAIFNFALSIFVLANNRRSRLNQVFFAWGLCITAWNFGAYALFRAPDPAVAALSAKYMLFGVIFIPVTLLHLSLLLTGTRPGRGLILAYVLHGGLAAMHVAGLFIQGVRHVGYAYYSIAGPGFYLYSFSLVTQSCLSILLLWRKRQELPPRQRRRFNGILTGQTLIVVFGLNDTLPIFGIDTYPIINAPILPYGSIAAVAYGIMVAYSVLHTQLLDVHLALGRTSAYLVRFFFLVGIAILLETTVAALAPAGQITTFALLSTIAVIIVSTLIASFLFPRLLGNSAESLERRFLGDHFEYQDKVRDFTEQSRWVTNMDDLYAKLHLLLVNTMRVRSYWIILLDQTKHAFTLVKAHPEQPEEQLPELRSDSAIFDYFLGGKATFISLKPDHLQTANHALQKAACADLSGFAAELAFALAVDGRPIGLLILGEKLSGDPFSRTDAQLLHGLTENLGLVINQISLENQLLQAQELDLLGKMSQGMAHDLNNLTTPVWTLLQMMAEGTDTPDTRSELAALSFRNMEVMRAYIREALFFSEHMRPDIHLGRLDVLVRNVADLAQHNRRKGKDIRYVVEANAAISVEMDHVLIERLLGNLISNAVDASFEGGTIRVELIQLAKTDPEFDWLRICVVDQGTGIKSENLNRILQPYFSTKKTGDENRGFGLGLAICRKIASLHNGNLSVQSTLGKGTTVNLDLPNRQKNIPTTSSGSIIKTKSSINTISS